MGKHAYSMYVPKLPKFSPLLFSNFCTNCSHQSSSNKSKKNLWYLCGILLWISQTRWSVYHYSRSPDRVQRRKEEEKTERVKHWSEVFQDTQHCDDTVDTASQGSGDTMPYTTRVPTPVYPSLPRAVPTYPSLPRAVPPYPSLPHTKDRVPPLPSQMTRHQIINLFSSTGDRGR